MPTGLERKHEEGDHHFITLSCFRRKPLLGSAQLRQCMFEVLNDSSKRYAVNVVAFVIMPEHLHLLLFPVDQRTLIQFIQVIKQRYSVAMKKLEAGLYHRVRQETAHPGPMPVWETRYFDFNVYSHAKMDEKVGYIHGNPVRRGLVERAEDWEWSSAARWLAESDRRYSDS